jgi:hypothetical protein
MQLVVAHWSGSDAPDARHRQVQSLNAAHAPSPPKYPCAYPTTTPPQSDPNTRCAELQSEKELDEPSEPFGDRSDGWGTLGN